MSTNWCLHEDLPLLQSELTRVLSETIPRVKLTSMKFAEPIWGSRLVIVSRDMEGVAIEKPVKVSQQLFHVQ